MAAFIGRSWGMASGFSKRLLTCTSMIHKCISSSSRILLQGNTRFPAPALQTYCSLHTSSSLHGLEEFFDDKENWGESKVKCGRPWRLDELRLKSNTDLHKLWYVLLKERNMIMTMEEEYKRCGELFPSPERLEKVEDSMENILDVVRERDNAYYELETGKNAEPGRRWTVNQLGLGYWRKNQEHHIPLALNKKFRKITRLNGPWQEEFKLLLKEKQAKRMRHRRRGEIRHKLKLKELFPHADID